MEEIRLSSEKKKKRKKVIIISLIIFSCMLISALVLVSLKGNKIKIAKNSSVNSNQPDSHQLENKQVDNNQDMDKREDKVPVGIDMDEHINELGSGSEKVAYLTFDDGPSRTVTPRLLDILNKYNIKATFFVIGQLALENKDIILKEKDEGEAIENHSYTHDYNYEYSNPLNLVDDFDKCTETLKSILGDDYKVRYVRFPGGSFGVKLAPFRKLVEKAGYNFIDWNCLNGDAEGNNISPELLMERVKETSGSQKILVILMHDAAAKNTTIEALPKIIEYLKSQGYVFKTLT